MHHAVLLHWCSLVLLASYYQPPCSGETVPQPGCIVYLNHWPICQLYDSFLQIAKNTGSISDRIQMSFCNSHHEPVTALIPNAYHNHIRVRDRCVLPEEVSGHASPVHKTLDLRWCHTLSSTTLKSHEVLQKLNTTVYLVNYACITLRSYVYPINCCSILRYYERHTISITCSRIQRGRTSAAHVHVPDPQRRTTFSGVLLRATQRNSQRCMLAFCGTTVYSRLKSLFHTRCVSVILPHIAALAWMFIMLRSSG